MGKPCRTLVFTDYGHLPHTVLEVLAEQRPQIVPGIIHTFDGRRDIDLPAAFRQSEIHFVILAAGKTLVIHPDTGDRLLFVRTEGHSVGISLEIRVVAFSAAQSKGRMIGCGNHLLHGRFSPDNRRPPHVVRPRLLQCFDTLGNIGAVILGMSIQPDNNLPGGLPNPDVERILNRFVGEMCIRDSSILVNRLFTPK